MYTYKDIVADFLILGVFNFMIFERPIVTSLEWEKDKKKLKITTKIRQFEAY